jgi:hypothetical protein
VTTVHEALNLVMQDVGAVKKLDHNSSGTGFNFRGIDAVTNAVYPALVKHKVIVAPKVLSYDYGTVVVGRNRTEMGHVRLTVEFTWYGPDGDSLVSVAAGEAFDSGDKATAKAHSVAFRTALLQTLCLPTDEPDPDSQSYERAPAKSEDDIAREELLAAAPDGWNGAKLADRFLSDHGVDIRQADAATVRAFTKAILAEAEMEPA